MENRPPAGELSDKFRRALARVLKTEPSVKSAAADIQQMIENALAVNLEETYLVGTGYGRVTLPFSKEHIRSEILCHGLGAHLMYPQTRTVLDIGGQDTKGIQIDENGIVANFQMNDRCAAGCGRYLGYIADEMNMGLHELGPMAMKSDRPARINSTCTVFAGAELRDRLSLGEKREDILSRPPSRYHIARDLHHLALGRRHQRVHLHWRRCQERGRGARNKKSHQGELRRGHDQYQSGLDLYWRARRGGVCAPGAFGASGRERIMTITAGIDIGTSTIKAALFKVENGKETWLSRYVMRIRQRDPMELARVAYDAVLEDAKLRPEDVDYVATTGEGESVPFHTGHFYSMTTHARGAIFLDPESRAALDIGALHGRAILIDGRGKVLSYKMTSQCASGSGQFLENIARYLGIAQEEIGSLSRQGDNPEVVSSICAVLAETDVINMVSRGISTSNILKGIHLSMAARLSKLLKSIGVVDGVVMVTGGLALDKGLVAALEEDISHIKDMKIAVRSHPDSLYAGTIGAALWGAFRFEKLAAASRMPNAA